MMVGASTLNGQKCAQAIRKDDNFIGKSNLLVLLLLIVICIGFRMQRNFSFIVNGNAEIVK